MLSRDVRYQTDDGAILVSRWSNSGATVAPEQQPRSSAARPAAPALRTDPSGWDASKGNRNSETAQTCKRLTELHDSKTSPFLL